MKALRERARDYGDRRQWAEAIDAYQLIVALAPNDVDSYNELGLLYETVGETVLCEQAYLKALEQDPDHADTLLNLGCFYRDQER